MKAEKKELVATRRALLKAIVVAAEDRHSDAAQKLADAYSDLAYAQSSITDKR